MGQISHSHTAFGGHQTHFNGHKWPLPRTLDTPALERHKNQISFLHSVKLQCTNMLNM